MQAITQRLLALHSHAACYKETSQRLEALIKEIVTKHIYDPRRRYQILDAVAQAKILADKEVRAMVAQHIVNSIHESSREPQRTDSTTCHSNPETSIAISAQLLVQTFVIEEAIRKLSENHNQLAKSVEALASDNANQQQKRAAADPNPSRPKRRPTSFGLRMSQAITHTPIKNNDRPIEKNPGPDEPINYKLVSYGSAESSSQQANREKRQTSILEFVTVKNIFPDPRI